MVEKGFDAREWAQIVSNTVGGKNGGNTGSAQGAGTDVSKIDDAIGLAKAFATKMTL